LSAISTPRRRGSKKALDCIIPTALTEFDEDRKRSSVGGEENAGVPMVGNDRHGQEEIMSVFGSIVSAIFGSKHAAGVTPTAGTSSSTGTSAPAGTGAGPGTSAAGAAAKPISRADVEAILKKLDDDQDEDFDWGKSITDLMKLLKLDSSLGARKQLAKELGYTGALDGSAEMNVWLHKQVMTKLAESGGKVPDSLKA
jgi:uncharacterized protein with von Willebrand factor type A (vWA) domain